MDMKICNNYDRHLLPFLPCPQYFLTSFSSTSSTPSTRSAVPGSQIEVLGRGLSLRLCVFVYLDYACGISVALQPPLARTEVAYTLLLRDRTGKRRTKRTHVDGFGRLGDWDGMRR